MSKVFNIDVSKSLISTTPNKFYTNEDSQAGNTIASGTWIYRNLDGNETTINYELRPYVYLAINNDKIHVTEFGFDFRTSETIEYNFIGFNYKSGVTTDVPKTGEWSYDINEVSIEVSKNNATNPTYINTRPRIKCIDVKSSTQFDKFINFGTNHDISFDSTTTAVSINIPSVYSDIGISIDYDINTLSQLMNEVLKDRYIIRVTVSLPTVYKSPVYFYNWESSNIGSGNVEVGTYDIDAIASLVGVSPIQQTKPSAKKSATTYNVNFYMDSSLTTRTGNSQQIKGGESTITYSHREDPDTRHFYWKNGKSGDAVTKITINRNTTYKFYPVFVESVTEATLPTNLPTSGFYGKERVGYRAENGSRINSTYYAKNGNQVERGGGITQDMITGTNIDLYLKWVPVKYTIRFNKGNADSWANPTNTLGTITKTYGENINTSDSRYPTQFTRLLLNGYLQRGWINNGSSVYSNGDNSICTYSYSGDYEFTKQPITDKWYNDNMSGVDVYPSWYPVNHKVLAHYYTTKGGTEKLDTYNFNIGSAHLSINDPKELDDKSSTWVFLGWAQITKPKGDDWEWGSGGTDIRNYGAFRYITDLKDIQYFKSYGVNSKSLTKEDWDNTSKNLDIYALWSINSRYVFVGNAWRPTTGIWVYVDGAWRSVDSIYYQSSSLPTTTTWKQEIVE